MYRLIMDIFGTNTEDNLFIYIMSEFGSGLGFGNDYLILNASLGL